MAITIVIASGTIVIRKTVFTENAIVLEITLCIHIVITTFYLKMENNKITKYTVQRTRLELKND